MIIKSSSLAKACGLKLVSLITELDLEDIDLDLVSSNVKI